MNTKNKNCGMILLADGSFDVMVPCNNTVGVSLAKIPGVKRELPLGVAGPMVTWHVPAAGKTALWNALKLHCGEGTLTIHESTGRKAKHAIPLAY